jgi:uncharacterized membrane protein YccC
MTNWLPNLDPFKCKQAFKTALAATMATIITLAFHMPHPFWAPSIVIMLLDNYAEGSLQKGITRFTSTIAGAVFAYYLGHFTLDYEILYYLSIFVVLSIAIYGFLIAGSAWLNFGVTFLFLTMYMVLDPPGGFEIAIWRSSEILTGVFCSILISNFVFPSNLVKDIRNNVKKLARESNELVGLIKSNEAIDTTTWKNDKSAFKDLLTNLETCQTLLSPRGKKGELSNALSLLLEQGWTWWRQTGQVYELLQQNPSLKASLLPFLNSFTILLNQWVNALDNNEKLTPAVDTIKSQFDAALLALTNNTTDPRNQAHYALIQTWAVVTEDWLIALKQFHNNEETNYSPTTIITPTLKEKMHTLYIKLNSKKSLMPHCMSIGLGCCMVTYVWLLTGWPGGVCAGISALVVGADSSLSKINLKIRLRLLGSIIGSAIGLFLYIFVVNSAFSMCLMVFLGVGVFTYLSQKNFSSMYINWMATMGFVITMVPDVVQTTDIAFSFERAFGLVMGLVVMAFVVNFFWPLNYKKQFNELCSNIKKKIAINWSLLGSMNSDNRDQVSNQIDNLQQQLLMLVSEGSAIAKPNKLMPIWLPIIDVIVTIPWVKNYSTKKSLAYLEEHYENQWSNYCKQTYDAVIAKTPDQLHAMKEQWDTWAQQLKNSDQDKEAVAQCWLMLQANERFCDALAKSQLYRQDDAAEEPSEKAASEIVTAL